MGRPPGNRQDLLQTFFKESGWGLSAPLEPPTPVGDPHLPSACLWYILYLLWSSALHPRAARGFYKSSPVLASATSTQEPEFLFVYPYGLYPSIQCYVVLLRYFVSGFQILRKMSLSHLTILAFSTCHVLRTVQAVNKCFFWMKERKKKERRKSTWFVKYSKIMEGTDGVKLHFKSKSCCSLSGDLGQIIQF